MASSSFSSTGPRYPYPSTLNVSNFVSLKLTQSNYLLWETQMLTLIESQDLLEFISGKQIIPEEEIDSTEGKRVTNPDYTSWVRTDRLIKAWITGTLAEDVLGNAVGAKTSLDLWNALVAALAQASEAREFDLLSKMQFHIKKDTDTLVDHLNGFKEICDNLNAIGKPLPDKRKVFALLTNLGPAFEAFSTTMLKPPVPSYAEVIPLLQSHALRIQSHVPSAVNHASAFYGERTSNGGRRNQKRGGNGSFTSRGKGFTQTANRPSKQPSDKPDHNNNRYSKPTCQICRKPGHIALKCWSRFDNSFQPNDIPQALAALHLPENSQDAEWFPDTGANAHITDDAGPKNTENNCNGE